jgi:hypothetical protein
MMNRRIPRKTRLLDLERRVVAEEAAAIVASVSPGERLLVTYEGDDDGDKAVEVRAIQ